MKLTRTNEDLLNYSDKYHFYHNTGNNTIVCTTSYKGQTIRGVAKCSPEDNFDIETGKRLAYLRCRLRFTEKKAKRARKAYNEALVAMAKTRHHLYSMSEFVEDSERQIEAASRELMLFEEHVLGL